MAITDPYTIFAGGIFVGGAVAGAILGPLTQHYGNVKTGAYVSALLIGVVAVTIWLIGVVFG